MAVVFTFILLIALELCGLYLASGLGQLIRKAFNRTNTSQRSVRLRWLDVMIGYAAIFVVFGLMMLLIRL